ncbi:MAG TPA: Hsp20/alpha crystallin family protein [Stellaceae bacterium]|nr:Hsp20/alpha crystallin family protein [Stellaceae bacterium]
MAVAPVEVKKTPAPRAPSDPWQNFRGEMDRLFDRFTGFGLPSLRRSFDLLPSFEPSFSFNVPAVDVTEDEKAYKVAAELPGLDEKDIEVSVTGDVLTIKGEKRQEKEEKSKNWYVAERTFGSFQRAFALPDGVDRNNIAADFSKGVLTVTLPKSAQAQKQQQKIEVKAT